MAVRIGIDIGSSTTKIVAFEGEHMLPPWQSRQTARWHPSTVLSEDICMRIICSF